MDGQTDLVIGWRRNRADPLLRKANALGWKTLVNLLFGYTAKDVDCAFKLLTPASAIVAILLEVAEPRRAFTIWS